MLAFFLFNSIKLNDMKKLLVMVATATLILSGCGASKKAAYSAASAPASNNPFGDVYEAPCAENDTPEYFTANGIATGSQARMGELQQMALANAQQIIRQKMQHAYKGAIDNYMNSVGNNAGTDIQSKLEAGGTQIMDLIVNETNASCGPKYSGVDARGNVTCYIGIRIPKKALAETIVDNVVDNVSDDEELQIRFKEDEFRKRTLENFERFKAESEK